MNSPSKEGNEEEFGQSNTPATPPRKKRSKGPMRKKEVQRALFSVEDNDKK